MTLIGTSPNIIVSKVREEIVGQPFGMFDFFPVGAGLAVAGVLFLTFGYRLLQPRQSGIGLIESALKIRYTAEAQFRFDSPFIGRTVAELEGEGDVEVSVSTIILERFRLYTPDPNWTLLESDVLLLQGEAEALDGFVTRTGLMLYRARDAQGQDHEYDLVEAVVNDGSPIIDMSAAELTGTSHFDLELVALSRGGQQITRRLNTVRFRSGDLVVLRGPEEQLPEAMVELGFLPLVAREIQLGQNPRRFAPLIVLFIAMLLIAFEIVPVAIGFFSAAVLMILIGSLTL